MIRLKWHYRVPFLDVTRCGLQARGRWKIDYYSDDDDEPAAPKPIANGVARAKPAPGRAGGKTVKDPAAEQRIRLLAQEAEVHAAALLR